MVALAIAALLLAGGITIAPRPACYRVVRSRRAPVDRNMGNRRVLAGGFVAAAIGLVLLPFPTTLAAAILLGAIWLRRRNRWRSRRRTLESKYLTTGLDVLVAELRIGAHPARAFAVAGSEVSGSVGSALRAVAARAHLGGDVEKGLRVVAEASIISAHWGRLAVCWNLAHRHGLAVSHLIAATARDMVERQRLSAGLDASLAGARATATILAALPLFGVLLGQSIGARPVELLLGGGGGGWLLVAGVFLVAIGLAWSDRIADCLYFDGRVGTARRLAR